MKKYNSASNANEDIDLKCDHNNDNEQQNPGTFYEYNIWRI